MALTIDWRLYLVLDTGLLAGREPVPLVQAALAGGVTVIQLRAKSWPAGRIYTLAKAIAPLVRDAGATILINDHVDIALATGADGVHLGVDDLPVSASRLLLSHHAIGYSPEGADDARRAVRDGADYLGVGPFAVTRTKPDAGQAIGASGLAEIVTAVTCPVVAVGGVTADNARAALMTGVAGIAVGSAIMSASDPTTAARQLRRIVGEVIDDRSEAGQ